MSNEFAICPAILLSLVHIEKKWNKNIYINHIDTCIKIEIFLQISGWAYNMPKNKTIVIKSWKVFIENVEWRWNYVQLKTK